MYIAFCSGKGQKPQVVAETVEENDSDIDANNFVDDEIDEFHNQREKV